MVYLNPNITIDFIENHKNKIKFNALSDNTFLAGKRLTEINHYL